MVGKIERLKNDASRGFFDGRIFRVYSCYASSDKRAELQDVFRKFCDDFDVVIEYGEGIEDTKDHYPMLSPELIHSRWSFTMWLEEGKGESHLLKYRKFYDMVEDCTKEIRKKRSQGIYENNS